MTAARAKCPGCGAFAAGGARCPYCGTPLVHALPAEELPLERQREQLREKISLEEREWNVRIARARRPMAADIGVPPALGCLATWLFALTAAGVAAGLGYDSDDPIVGLIDLAAFVVIAAIVVLVMRRRRRTRIAESMTIVRQREQALAPLREELRAVEEQLATTAPRLTARERLQAQRDAVKHELDAKFWRVEEARTSSYSDFVVVPLGGGCGGLILASLVGLLITGGRSGEVLADMVSAFVGLLIIAASVVAVYLWRTMARKRRIAELTRDRDESVPALQQRLRELDNELERLAPER